MALTGRLAQTMFLGSILQEPRVQPYLRPGVRGQLGGYGPRAKGRAAGCPSEAQSDMDRVT